MRDGLLPFGKIYSVEQTQQPHEQKEETQAFSKSPETLTQDILSLK